MDEFLPPEVEPLPPEVEARIAQRLSILLGLVTLAEMSQAEVDSLFRAKVRLAGD